METLIKSTFETPLWKWRCADPTCSKVNGSNDPSCVQCRLSREKSFSYSYQQKAQNALDDGEIRERGLGAILDAIQSKLRNSHMEWKQVGEIGPLHDKTFEYQLKIGEWIGKGIGNSMNDSKIKAAEDILIKLDQYPKLFPQKRRGKRKEDILKAQPPLLGDNLMISTPPPPLEYKPCQVDFTPPPPLEDNFAYICVTNDELVTGEYLHLPLNADFTLSMSTLDKVFPEATGLYFYAFSGYDGINHNFLFEVSQDGEMLFPPSTGDEVIYITKTKMHHDKVKDDSKNFKYMMPKECSGCSDLKMQVDQLSIAIKEIKTEISEMKKGKDASQLSSQLDVNANIFRPALRSSHQDSAKKYPMNMRQFNENEEIRQMEACVEMKEVELIDLVSDGVKNATSVNMPNSIEHLDDENISKINERTASWILNLPIPSNKLNLPTPMNTNNETAESINSRSNKNDQEFNIHSIKNNQFVSDEKSFSHQMRDCFNSQDRMMNDNHVKDFETNVLFEPLQATPKEKDVVEGEAKSIKTYEQFETFRAKLRSSKGDKESSIQSVLNINLVSENKSFCEEQVKMHDQSGANDNQIKNNQSVNDKKSYSDKFLCDENQSYTTESSSHYQSLKCNNIVQFDLQRGSSFELSEQKVFDFFSTNYGKVNTVGYNSSSGKGTVSFASGMANSVVDKEIEIGECSLYTSRRMEDLTKESVKTQILLESRHLPMGWERSIILRKHFEKFGKVAGVVFIGTRGGVYKVIIGFENKETVEKLEGITEIINGAKVVVQRVNAETVKWDKLNSKCWNFVY